jgi:hypothetical protein
VGQLIKHYLWVCAVYNKRTTLNYQRLSNFKPVFTDEELLTVTFPVICEACFNNRCE